jgi:hypothetical protein
MLVVLFVAAGFDDDSSARASESRALVVAALERSMLNTAKQEVSKRGSQTGNGKLSDVILICSRLGAGALGSGSVALKVSRRSRQSVCRQEVSSLWYSSHPSYFVHRAHCFFFLPFVLLFVFRGAQRSLALDRGDGRANLRFRGGGGETVNSPPKSMRYAPSLSDASKLGGIKSRRR